MSDVVHFANAMPHRLIAALLLALACTVQAADGSILTSTERGTAIEAGRNLARFIARPAGVTLDVLPTNGSADNVQRLPGQPGVRLALVQADVYGAYVGEAAGGDADAARLARPLRVVMPLYDEEVYFVARADSPLRFVSDIRDSRINLGPPGSGSALTATNLYRSMFGVPPEPAATTALSNEEALVKLTTDKSIDVVVVVAGQPARLFAEMTPQARQYIKLLPVDPLAPETLSLAAPYSQAVIRRSVYPKWLAEDVPAFAVQSLLVTWDVHTTQARDSLVRLAESMCQNFDRLKAEGHAKWREVSLGQPPLPRGWLYYTPTRKVLSTCAGAAEARMVALITAAAGTEANRCSPDRALLGLCRAPAP